MLTPICSLSSSERSLLSSSCALRGGPEPRASSSDIRRIFIVAGRLYSVSCCFNCTRAVVATDENDSVAESALWVGYRRATVSNRKHGTKSHDNNYGNASSYKKCAVNNAASAKWYNERLTPLGDNGDDFKFCCVRTQNWHYGRTSNS